MLAVIFPNNWFNLNGKFQTSDLSAFPTNSINIWIMALTSNRLFPPPRRNLTCYTVVGCLAWTYPTDSPNNMIKTTIIMLCLALHAVCREPKTKWKANDSYRALWVTAAPSDSEMMNTCCASILVDYYVGPCGKCADKIIQWIWTKWVNLFLLCTNLSSTLNDMRSPFNRNISSGCATASYNLVIVEFGLQVKMWMRTN